VLSVVAPDLFTERRTCKVLRARIGLLNRRVVEHKDASDPEYQCHDNSADNDQDTAARHERLDTR
jgi:hypothetical protein